jgi:hypothetical protein
VSDLMTMAEARLHDEARAFAAERLSRLVDDLPALIVGKSEAEIGEITQRMFAEAAADLDKWMLEHLPIRGEAAGR